MTTIRRPPDKIAAGKKCHCFRAPIFQKGKGKWPMTMKKRWHKIGNVNKSILPVIKRAQGNNGIVFNG